MIQTARIIATLWMSRWQALREDEGASSVEYTILVVLGIAVAGLVGDSRHRSGQHPRRQHQVVLVRTSDARARNRGRRPRIGRRRERDDGSSTLEYAILVPVVLAMLFTCIQVSLYSFARSVALTAAQEGANAQRAYGAAPGAGEQKADEIINAQGDVLQGWQVSVTTSGGEVVVTVTGSSLSLFPGVAGFNISQTSSGPIEVFHQ